MHVDAPRDQQAAELVADLIEEVHVGDVEDGPVVLTEDPRIGAPRDDPALEDAMRAVFAVHAAAVESASRADVGDDEIAERHGRGAGGGDAVQRGVANEDALADEVDVDVDADRGPARHLVAGAVDDRHVAERDVGAHVPEEPEIVGLGDVALGEVEGATRLDDGAPADPRAEPRGRHPADDRARGRHARTLAGDEDGDLVRVLDDHVAELDVRAPLHVQAAAAHAGVLLDVANDDAVHRGPRVGEGHEPVARDPVNRHPRERDLAAAVDDHARAVRVDDAQVAHHHARAVRLDRAFEAVHARGHDRLGRARADQRRARLQADLLLVDTLGDDDGGADAATQGLLDGAVGGGARAVAIGRARADEDGVGRRVVGEVAGGTRRADGLASGAADEVCFAVRTRLRHRAVEGRARHHAVPAHLGEAIRAGEARRHGERRRCDGRAAVGRVDRRIAPVRKRSPVVTTRRSEDEDNGNEAHETMVTSGAWS